MFQNLLQQFRETHRALAGTGIVLAGLSGVASDARADNAAPPTLHYSCSVTATTDKQTPARTSNFDVIAKAAKTPWVAQDWPPAVNKPYSQRFIDGQNVQGEADTKFHFNHFADISDKEIHFGMKTESVSPDFTFDSSRSIAQYGINVTIDRRTGAYAGTWNETNLSGTCHLDADATVAPPVVQTEALAPLAGQAQAQIQSVPNTIEDGDEDDNDEVDCVYASPDKEDNEKYTNRATCRDRNGSVMPSPR